MTIQNRYTLIVTGDKDQLFKFANQNREQDHCFSIFEHKLNKLMHETGYLTVGNYPDRLVDGEIPYNGQHYKLYLSKECYCTRFNREEIDMQNAKYTYHLEVDNIIYRFVKYIQPFYPNLTFTVQI